MRRLLYALTGVLIVSMSGCASLGGRLISQDSQTRNLAVKDFKHLDSESKERVARDLIKLLKLQNRMINRPTSLPDDEVAKCDVIEALHRTIDALKIMETAALNPLVEEMKNEHQTHQPRGIQKIASDIICEMGKDAAPAIPQLKALANDDSTFSNFIFPTILSRIGPADIAIPALIENGSDSSDDALAAMGPEAVPYIIKVIDRDDGRKRKRLIKLLGKIGPGSKDAVPSLIGWLTADIASHEIIETLGEIGPSAKTALPYLQKCCEINELKDVAMEAIEQIDPLQGAQIKDKEMQSLQKETKFRQDEHTKWQNNVGALMVDGKLTIPDTEKLLMLAGYTNTVTRVLKLPGLQRL